MRKLIDIEGIGEASLKKLQAAGVPTLKAFLGMCASPSGRKSLEEKTGISHAEILRWTNHADLARINGIGGQYAELLETAGVDSVPELAHRNAEHLLAKMSEINQAKKLIRRLPPMSRVTNWIDQAKTLPKVVTH
ncbi:MAG: DUF4332 domain-containing protein [Chlorobiaceae bacterium]|nr:DUF4332 domain-containing protein [Chlorobiaceae bacterium]